MELVKIYYRHIRKYRPNWPAARCWEDAKSAVEAGPGIYRDLLLCYRTVTAHA